MVDPRGGPASIYPGEMVVFNPEIEPAADHLVIARHADAALIRRMRVVTETAAGKPELVALVPADRAVDVVVVSVEQTLAVAIGTYRKI